MATLSYRFQQITTTPTYITIALGVVLVGWQALAGSIPWLVQLVVLAILLVGTGIPHGALDHLIDRETATRRGKSFSSLRFLVRYLLTMALFGITWFIAPALSLVLFLFISAWHFGETDIEHVPSTPIWVMTRFVAGSFVLVFMLLTHAFEVTPILERIAHNHALTMFIWRQALLHPSAVWLHWGLLTGYLFSRACKSRPVTIDWFRLVRLVIVLALGYWLPLLLAFSLYFGGWHALSSFQTIYGYLKQNQKITLTVGQIWLKSVPFTVLALGALAVFVWWWELYAQKWDPLPLLFIFLSLITLPHLNVMHGMNSRID